MKRELTYSRQFGFPPDDTNSVHELLEEVWIGFPAASSRDRISFETALIELASNVISHSQVNGAVACSITIAISNAQIEATVIDTGEIATLRLGEYAMPDDDLSESGRGIPLIKALSHEFTHRVEHNLNEWYIARRFNMANSEPAQFDSLALEMDEARRQEALERLHILDTPPEERFDRITRLAKQLIGVETAVITLIDNDRQWFKSRAGTELSEGTRRDAFCNTTIGQSEVLDIPDALKDPRFANNPMVLAEPNIRFYAGYPIQAPGGERVGSLCVFDPKPRNLTEAEKSILQDLALWVQNELTISQEFDRAAEVQRGLLPKQHANLHNFDIAGACAPARSVGGDFYDWYPVEEGEAFTLADVMGKGMAAAIIAATVRAVLRSGSRRDDIERTMSNAALLLQADLDESGSFVTLFHARLNRDTGLVRFIDAGHGLSSVIRQAGGTERLTSNNPPLGFDIDSEWTEQNYTLLPGDTLISVSDGVLDLFDSSATALAEIERVVRTASSAQAIVDDVVGRVGGTSADDVTVLVVRRTN